MAGQSRSKSQGKSRAVSSRAGSARGNFGVVRWASNELLAETLKMWDKVDPLSGIELRYLPSAAGSGSHGPLDETGFAGGDGAGATPPGPDDATVERGPQQLQFEAVPTPPSRDNDPSRQGVAIQGASIHYMSTRTLHVQMNSSTTSSYRPFTPPLHTPGTPSHIPGGFTKAKIAGEMIMPADGMWEVTLAVTKTKPMGKAQGAESDSVTLSFGPDPKSLSLFTQILNEVNEDDGTYRHEIKYHFRGEKLAYQFDWHRTAHVRSEGDGGGGDGGSGGGSRPTSRATRVSSASTRATTADSTDDDEEEEGKEGRPRTGASRGSRVMSAGSASTTVSGHCAGLEFQVRARPPMGVECGFTDPHPHLQLCPRLLPYPLPRPHPLPLPRPHSRRVWWSSRASSRGSFWSRWRSCRTRTEWYHRTSKRNGWRTLRAVPHAP